MLILSDVKLISNLKQLKINPPSKIFMGAGIGYPFKLLSLGS